MGQFKYKEQYGIVVVCSSEKEQQALYERLKEMGLTLKVVTV